MSINVTVVGSTGVSTSIASSDQIVVAVGGTLANTPLTALQVTAGANITITTTSGVYTFIGPNVPVQSVNGQTGTVVLNLANLTAAAASHTHLMANITDLAFPVSAVNGKTGTVVLTSTDVSAASASHTHVASDITNLTSVANVVSVNGQTGVAVLNSTNVSAASAVHTHVMANITDLAFPVSSVNGKAGTVSLTITDLTAAAATHAHVASDITNLTSVANVVSVNGITGTPSIVGGVGVTVSTSGSSITIEAAGSTAGGASLSDALPQALGSPTAGTSGLASRSDHAHAIPSAADVGAAAIGHTHAMVDVSDLAFPVTSVNGQTGTVSLTITDLTAAAASHTHAASEVTDLTSVANVISVNGQTGVVTIALGDALPPQGGKSTNVLTTDGTAASWATRYSVVDPVLVAGPGLSFSRDTSAGQITIEAAGGIVGSTAASVSTKTIFSDQNNYDAGVADIVRLSPAANVTLTGLAGGSDGVVRVLYNVGTHVVTLSSGNTNSESTNRFSIVSGDAVLGEGDSSSVWYDGTSGRWRVLEDKVSGGGGGGVAMSYLFG